MTRPGFYPPALALVLAVASGAAVSAQTTPFCATRNSFPNGDPVPLTYEGTDQYVSETVTIEAAYDSQPLQGDGLAAGKLIEGLNAASNTVNSCPPSENVPGLQSGRHSILDSH